MRADHLPAFVQMLLDPAAYDHPVEDVRLVQTHISYVLLAGAYVYKFKKPVDFGFLDFSTLAKRKACCERELRLNRRLCPDIYLGLVTVNERGGALTLNGSGSVIEHGVRMVRMPEDRMMARVISRNELGEQDIADLVDILVPFYNAAESSPEIDGFGSAESVAVNVLENFEQTRSFIGQGGLEQTLFETISVYAKGVLSQPELFERRIRQGRIRDCHGDLYSANICLDTPIHIYDCIEFNDRFRYSDVASDVAFLAMDLDFHGLMPLSRRFVELFASRSGDAELMTMLAFYKCYRAYVRGKIGLFTAADPKVEAKTRSQALDNCSRYFALASAYARGEEG